MGLVRSSFARKLASEIKIKTDSERLAQSSNLRLRMTLCLSLTVSELIAFVCGPEMASSGFSGFSATWRRRPKVSADSEKRSPFPICD